MSAATAAPSDALPPLGEPVREHALGDEEPHAAETALQSAASMLMRTATLPSGRASRRAR